MGWLVRWFVGWCVGWKTHRRVFRQVSIATLGSRIRRQDVAAGDIHSVEYSSFCHIFRATRIFLILGLETVASRVDWCSARAQSDEHGEQKKELEARVEDEGLL